jgi:outer membrane protein assembly factor BamB
LWGTKSTRIFAGRQQVVFLLILLVVSSVASIHVIQENSVRAQVGVESSSTTLLDQYDWTQPQGDASFTRFSAGPAPSTPNNLWKAKVPGIQPYITAFNDKIFVGTNTSLVCIDQSGNVVWDTQIPMNRTWPIAYKIDDSHLVVESSCLDINSGQIIWTSPAFSSDTGIFNSAVYSPTEKMFYTKVNSYILSWDFSDPSKPPTLAWKTYIQGGGITGIGITYGEGKIFTGSFMNQQYALDAKTGAILWTALTRGPMIFNGAYSDGRYFIGGTDDNTMYCFNATDGQILWTYQPGTNGYFTTGPAVAYGLVYEMNKDGYLYAINIQTGIPAWKYKGPDENLIWPGMPTVADGKIYVTTGELAQYVTQYKTYSEFACLNAYTGQVIWTLPIEALPPRESAIVAYGNLYIIPGSVTTAVDTTSGTEYTTDSELWAIGANSIPVSNWPMWRSDPTHSSTAQVGPSNLSLAWKFETNGSVISSPSVVDGVAYVGSQDKNIYAIGAWSGSLIWKYATDGPVISSPAVANGRVYVGSEDGYAYSLDSNTGTLIWKTFVYSNLEFTFGDLVLKSSPVVAEGKVYIGSLDGNLYALDENNGHVVWKAKTAGPIECSPAYADGALYFTSDEPTAGNLYKIDAANGNIIWNLTLPYQYSFVGGTEMLGSPSIAAGMVFASSDFGAYYAVNADSGEIVWKFIDKEAIEFIVSSPIYVNGDLFIIHKFNIECLNATNGNLIWSTFTGDELYTSPSYADGKIYLATSQRDIFILDTANNGVKIATGILPSSSWSSPTIANGRLYVGCNDWNVYSFSNDIINQAPTTTPSTKQNNGWFESRVVILIAVIVVVLIIMLAAFSYLLRKRVKK